MSGQATVHTQCDTAEANDKVTARRAAVELHRVAGDIATLGDQAATALAEAHRQREAPTHDAEVPRLSASVDRDGGAL
ncbi:MAG TPA: hypothetical protein VGS97_14025 [Actinocrinis sp.]|uniref:hypothetical protein n=1 Tax=Actinocrinis sp. TaxID=1920516 RepID=UPI002DDD57E8|nr:hypothetical protein [Actinocrinis sp.]HEV2345211.1 hypothetical protein [Actinocrinis sp.]